jgi:hypothetical protein
VDSGIVINPDLLLNFSVWLRSILITLVRLLRNLEQLTYGSLELNFGIVPGNLNI